MDESAPKTLYLLRHAKAHKGAPDQPDRDRALTRRGREAVERIAAHCDAEGVRPALVLCSPATRTRETCELVLPALGQPKVVIEERLYGASEETLLALVAALPRDARAAMIVGHNPGLEELASRLAGHGPARLLARLKEKFPTGVLATFAAPVDDWRRFATASGLESFIRPTDLV
jgi:phosphohistidine phosphatase